MGQMLGSVEETSFGLVSITPRDEHGYPIATEDLVNYVVKDENGNPLKEWDAIADYLYEMNGVMDERYAKPDGRKVIYASWNIADLLRNANVYTYILIAIISILIIAIVFIVHISVVIRKKKKEKKA